MYAMKYVHKNECAERGALKNVAREVEILSKLEHPCLVNLWFSFQGKSFFETSITLSHSSKSHGKLIKYTKVLKVLEKIFHKFYRFVSFLLAI